MTAIARKAHKIRKRRYTICPCDNLIIGGFTPSYYARQTDERTNERKWRNAMTKDKKPSKNLTHDDRNLWDFVTRNVRPLLHRPAPSAAPVPPKPEKRPEPTTLPSADFSLEFGLKPLAPPVPAEQPGLDRRSAEKLRKGQMPIEARLDLHGLRQGEAQAQLTRFLTNGYHGGRRCVLVITGKGSRNGEAGVLRRLVPFWLQMHPLAPMILSHSPAKPKDGGDGAFYILLRRKR